MNLFKFLNNYLLTEKTKNISGSCAKKKTENKLQSITAQETGVKIIGCECGNSKIVSRKPDKNYGQYYCKIECYNCDYYWEGYMGHC